MSKITLLVLVITTAMCTTHAAPNIVIVGAGTSGASCAYYIKQLIPKASITILEAKERIGKSLIIGLIIYLFWGLT